MGLNLNRLLELAIDLGYNEREFLRYCTLCDNVIVDSKSFDDLTEVAEQIFAEQFIIKE